MDLKKPDVIRECSPVEETNLPEVMASLEMLTVDSNVTKSAGPKRALRKRVARPNVAKIPNRRCNQKPTKRKFTELETEADIKDYYLDKKLKGLANNLETIYEETEESPGSEIHIGVKKFKRIIEFGVEPTVAKIKKRQAKAKRILGSGFSRLLKRKRMTMQALFEKLNSMQSEPAPEFEAEVK